MRRAGRPLLRPPTNCASPEIRRFTSTNPRSSSALVISSRPNTRRPVAAPTSAPTGAGVSGARALVRIATRPPGASTRAIASSAASGSSNRCSAAKQQIASNEPSRNGSRIASPRT